MTLNGVSNGFQERAMVFYWFPIIFQMVAMVFNRLHFGQQKTWPDTSSKVVNAPRPNDKCYALHMFALVLRWLPMVFPMVFQERAMVFWWFPMIFQMVAMVFNWLHFSQQKTWPDKSSKVVNAPRPNDKCYDLCFPHVCNGSKMTLNGVSNGFPRTCNGLRMISNDFPNGCNGFQQVAFAWFWRGGGGGWPQHHAKSTNPKGLHCFGSGGGGWHKNQQKSLELYGFALFCHQLWVPRSRPVLDPF